MTDPAGARAAEQAEEAEYPDVIGHRGHCPACAEKSAQLAEQAATIARLEAEIKKANTTDPVKRLHNLVDGLGLCDICYAETEGGEGPNVLCTDCLTRLKTAESQLLSAEAAREEATKERAALQLRLDEMEAITDATGCDRLLLSSYGRRCYDAGRVQAESRLLSSIEKAEAKLSAVQQEIAAVAGDVASVLSYLQRLQLPDSDQLAQIRRVTDWDSRLQAVLTRLKGE